MMILITGEMIIVDLILKLVILMFQLHLCHRKEKNMNSISSLQIGKIYVFITTENKEYKGKYLDKDNIYIYLKNVKYGGKFSSLYTLPIELIIRIS